MSLFPAPDTFIREVAPVRVFSGGVKTGPSDEPPLNKYARIKETPNSFNRDLNPVIRVLQATGVIPITKTPRGTTSLQQAGA
jgi:hypothetical protein